jgi:hypothetical protein
MSKNKHLKTSSTFYLATIPNSTQLNWESHKF